MTQLYAASNQWFSRPKDERFLTLEDLYSAVDARRQNAKELMKLPLHNLNVDTDGEDVFIAQYGGAKTMFNHWSFGQLCSMTGVPADYMRKISDNKQLVVDNLQYGLRGLDAERQAKMLWNPPNGHPGVARAFNGVDYGRIWDAQLAKVLLDRFAGDPHWGVPLEAYNGVNSIEATTLYASDRDIFVFLTDETRPIEVGGSTLHRGFYTWNSEVGKNVWGLTMFLFDRVCANRIIWGATDVKELRIRHTKKAPGRFEDEALPALNAMATISEASPSGVIELVKAAKATLFAPTVEAVTERLMQRGFQKSEIAPAIKLAADESGIYGSTGGDPRTIWNLVSGGTAAARTIQHTDQRTDLERRWSSLLQQTGVSMESGLVTLEVAGK
jgi:hypothetical protein